MLNIDYGEIMKDKVTGVKNSIYVAKEAVV